MEEKDPKQKILKFFGEKKIEKEEDEILHLDNLNIFTQNFNSEDNENDQNELNLSEILEKNNFSSNNISIFPQKKEPNAVKYIGFWKSNIINGKGIYYYENGEKYSGDFIMGKKSGKGKIFYANGNLKYSGEFAMDKITGKIIFI